MPTLRLLVSLRGDGPLDAEEDMAAVLWVPGVCCGHEAAAYKLGGRGTEHSRYVER